MSVCITITAIGALGLAYAFAKIDVDSSEGRLNAAVWGAISGSLIVASWAAYGIVTLGKYLWSLL